MAVILICNNDDKVLLYHELVRSKRIFSEQQWLRNYAITSDSLSISMKYVSLWHKLHYCCSLSVQMIFFKIITFLFLHPFFHSFIPFLSIFPLSIFGWTTDKSNNVQGVQLGVYIKFPNMVVVKKREYRHVYYIRWYFHYGLRTDEVYFACFDCTNWRHIDVNKCLEEVLSVTKLL